MKTVGIDIGTTSIVVLVYDCVKKYVCNRKKFSNNFVYQRSGSDSTLQDAEAITDCILNHLSTCIEEFPDITGIGLSGQMHGIVYINREGRAVGPLYTWLNTLGNKRLYNDKETVVEKLNRLTGKKLASGFGMVTFYVHHKTSQIPKDAVTFCTISDYLGMALTKRTKPLLHSSQAAGLGLFNLEKHQFERALLEKNQIPLSYLPDTTKEFACLGDYQGIPVFIALGDSQSAYLGAVGNNKNTLFINIGTGSQIALKVPQYKEMKDLETRPLLDDQYLLTGACLAGGKSYAILFDFFQYFAQLVEGREITYELMEEWGRKALKEEQGISEEVILNIQTTFLGTREDPDQKGSISNLDDKNLRPGNLVLGCLRGMVDELYSYYDKMKKEEIHCEKIIGAGNGLTQNTLLQELLEKRFDLSLELPLLIEEAALGAAMMVCKQFDKEGLLL